MSDNSGRVIHYYARFPEHRSGVTESIAGWLSMSELCLPTELWMAPNRRGERHRDLALVDSLTTVVREVFHFGWDRRTYVPVIPLSRVHRGDVFVVHEGWVLSNLVAMLCAKARGAVCISVPHGVYESAIVSRTKDFLGIRKGLEGLMLGHVDEFHLFYPSEARCVEAVAGHPVKYKAIPNPVPLLPSGSIWSAGNTRDYFLWLGRFDIRHKGIDNLVRMWATLPQPRPKLVLAGPDYLSGKQTILEIVSNLGLEKSVSVRDSVIGDEKEELILGAKGYIHPSRWESCSMVLNEMLGYGVPCLVSEDIHAARPLRDLGLVSTYSDASSFRVGLSSLTDPCRGGPEQVERAHVLGADEVGRDYRRWLQRLMASGRKNQHG